MAKFLGIAFEEGEISSLVAFASALGGTVDVLLLGTAKGGHSGVDLVLQAGLDPIPPSDNISRGIASISKPYSHVFGVSSMRAKDLLHRVAGHLDAAIVTDVVRVDGLTQFQRPVLAGSFLATVSVEAEQTVLTFRPSQFPAPEAAGTAQLQDVSIPVEPKSVRVSSSGRGGGRPDLSQAKTIVSGGRPLRDAETFERVLGGLADALGGAVGATRAAVDSGIAPNELQVGQTGKIVAPNLYIAAGVSGSTQHVAGMKDSKVIVAINTDPDAAIFEVADFGLVADLYQAIPELQAKLAK